MVPGALLPLLPPLAGCCTLLALVLKTCPPFSTRKRLAEVTIQVDFVGARTTRSTSSLERRSFSTSRSSATRFCIESAAPSSSLTSASPSLSSAFAVAHAALVGCAVVCCRVGSAVALIGSRRCSRRLCRRLLSLRLSRRCSRCSRRLRRRLLSLRLSPSLSSALAVVLITFVGCAVDCCRFGFAVALIIGF